MSQTRRFYLTLIVVGVLAIMHIVWMAFVCDDAFISFRYARNLVEGHGLVFNIGERVEGYTNFLWTLLMSLVIALGASPEIVSVWIGGCLALATLVAVMRLGFQRQGDYLFTGVLLASNGGLATWATSGLETSLFTFLITIAFVFTVRALDDAPSASRTPLISGSSIALLLAALTRPEGIFIAALFGAILLALTLRRQLPWRTLLIWALPIVVGFGIYVIWRLSYYGHLVPNTFYVKAGGLKLVPFGIQYFLNAFRRWYIYIALLPLVILVVAGIRLGVGRRAGTLAAVVIVPYVIYVILIGGDFMDMFRFLVPVLPIALYICGQTWGRMHTWIRERARPILAVGVMALLVVANSVLNFHSSRDSQAVWYLDGLDSVGLMRKYRDDWTIYARHLQTHCLPTDAIAVNAAGIIPYYTRAYTIDMLGLISPTLFGFVKRNPPRPGHTLAASGWLILQLNPEYIIAHPSLIEDLNDAQARLPITDEELALIAERYEKIGAVVAQNPTRYAVYAVRKDIVAARGLQ